MHGHYSFGVLDSGPAELRYAAAWSRPVLYDALVALGQLAGDLHERIGPGPLGRGVLLEALEVLQLLIN
jgi:hypothetical protein